MLKLNKRGVSVLIGYVLLVVFAVVLAGIVFAWLRSYVPAEALNCPEGTSVFIKESSFDDVLSQVKIILKNNGRFDVAGFFIHVTNSSTQEVATIDISNYSSDRNLIFGNSIVYSIGSNSMNPGDAETTLFDLAATPVGEPHSVSIIPVRYQIESNRERFVSCGNAKAESLIGEPGVENICVPTITCSSLGYTQCNPPGWNQSDGCTLGALNCGGCPLGQSCNATGQCATPPSGCGDGSVNSQNEQCDNGVQNGVACTPPYSGSCTYCSSLCQNVTVQGPRCGDGIIQTTNGEACDDGGTVSGNGCSATCQIETGWTCSGQPSICQKCGNGIREGNEQCDDGNIINNDFCSNSCTLNPGTDCSANCIALPPPDDYGWGYCIPSSNGNECTARGGARPFSGNQFCGAQEGQCCCIP